MLLFFGPDKQITHALQRYHTTIFSTIGKKPDIRGEICCSLNAVPSMELRVFRGKVSELFSALQEALHLEIHGRASLNRAIFMLAEQNTYIVKWAARCKETRGNMSEKQLFKPIG